MFHRAAYGNAAPQLSTPTTALLITVLVLVVLSLLLLSGLCFFRRRRRARTALALPFYEEKRISTSSTHSNHRRIRVRPSQSVHIYSEKVVLEEFSRSSTPINGVPEIRITFPEEFDPAGKRKSGRVVVVHVGDNGVGLEPCQETLPAYQDGNGNRLCSVDLERVGGLVEKERAAPRNWREEDM